MRIHLRCFLTMDMRATTGESAGEHSYTVTVVKSAGYPRHVKTPKALVLYCNMSISHSPKVRITVYNKSPHLPSPNQRPSYATRSLYARKTSTAERLLRIPNTVFGAVQHLTSAGGVTYVPKKRNAR